MESLKMKLLHLGIYGTSCNNFTDTEIKMLFTQTYAEFYHGKYNLENDLNEDDIEKCSDCEAIVNEPNNYIVRVKYYVFKECLSRFKFKDDYPYKIIDLLLKSDGYIKTEHLRTGLGLDAKRVFYVLKRLREHKMLDEKKEKNIYYFKIKKDELFGVPVETQKIYGSPDIPKTLSCNIPLLDQIRYLIHTSTLGITTQDVRKEFGISVRQGLHYLCRIVEMDPKKYKAKEIFIGKSRCFLYSYITEEPTALEKKEQYFITHEDRIIALNKLLQKHKSIIICDETIKQFQVLLNSKYVPCKKTILSTALKAGHKIFVLKENHERRTLILEKDNDIDDYLKSLQNNEIVFKKRFHKKFYQNFVLLTSFIVQDNLYVTSNTQRLRILYELLYKNSVDGYVLFDKHFVNNINLVALFQILPVNMPFILQDIIKEYKNNTESNGCSVLNNECNDVHSTYDSTKFNSYYNDNGTTTNDKHLCNNSWLANGNIDSTRNVVSSSSNISGLANTHSTSHNEVLDDMKLTNTTECHDKQLPVNLAIVKQPQDTRSHDISILQSITLASVHGNKLCGNRCRLLKIQTHISRLLKSILQLENENTIEKYVISTNTSELSVNDITYNGNVYTKIKHNKIKLHNDGVLIKLIETLKTTNNCFYEQEKEDLYISFDERMKLMNIVESEDKSKAYKIVKRYIKDNYNKIYGRFKNLLTKVFNVKKKRRIRTNANTDEYLYTKIKYDLYKYNHLKINEYSSCDTYDVLQKLKSDGVIVSKERNICISNVSLNLKYKNRLDKSHTNSKNRKYTERDTVYSIYFDIVYDILVASGSLEFTELLARVRVCQDFELRSFFCMYKDIFQLTQIDSLSIVSLKIEIDPFVILN